MRNPDDESARAGSERAWTLVQGGSRGIGLEMVQQCLAAGEGVVATSRGPRMPEALQALSTRYPRGELVWLRLELGDESTIAAAAEALSARVQRLHRLVNVSGLLHEGELGPERRVEEVDPGQLARVFEVNAFGPLLVAKHFKSFLQHDEGSVLANVSARVGSIGDNRAGGWYAYRASKAAQNMFTRNLSIELTRRFPKLVVVALHPGTVDTELSAPFTRRYPREKLFDVERGARQLLDICRGLTPADNGRFIAWDGSDIEW